MPVTPLGKLLAAFIMIIGVTYTAMPLTLVGVRYYACYKEQKEREFVAYKKVWTTSTKNKSVRVGVRYRYSPDPSLSLTLCRDVRLWARTLNAFS